MDLNRFSSTNSPFSIQADNPQFPLWLSGLIWGSSACIWKYHPWSQSLSREGLESIWIREMCFDTGPEPPLSSWALPRQTLGQPALEQGPTAAALEINPTQKENVAIFLKWKIRSTGRDPAEVIRATWPGDVVSEIHTVPLEIQDLVSSYEAIRCLAKSVQVSLVLMARVPKLLTRQLNSRTHSIKDFFLNAR